MTRMLRKSCGLSSFDEGSLQRPTSGQLRVRLALAVGSAELHERPT